MGRKPRSKELNKIGLSTSIPQFYLLRLEEIVEKSKGRLTLAALARLILMDFIEKGGELP